MENGLQTFQTNGAPLHYLKSGTGPPLFFIPGSISDYRTWTTIYQRFSDQHTCYLLSRRYQFPGKHTVGGDSCVEVNTSDLASFIKNQKLAPVNIIGHSFGGFVALNLAIQFPELVNRVVAEEPIFAPALVRNPKNPLELLALMFKSFKAGKSFARLGMKGIEPTFKSLAKGDTETAQITFIDGVTGGKKTPATLDELTRNQLKDNIAALAGEDPFNNNIQMNDLSKIKCNVLLLSGTESPYVFQYINAQLNKRISSSQLMTIHGAGHWMHIDQSDRFVQIVADFI